MDNQRIAMIGSVGAVWISLGGLLILAALFDHDIATITVQAFVAIALGSSASTAAVHIWGQPSLAQALAPALARVDPQTAASIAPAVATALTPAAPAPAPAPAPVLDPNAAEGPSS